MKPIALPIATLAGALFLAAACEPAPTAIADEMEAALGDHAAHVMTARPASAPPSAAPDLARMRAGSAPYRNYAKAGQDGFIDVSGCVQAPPIPGFPFTGAMGHHYVNFDRLADIGVDPANPEILLYMPNRQGRMELVGVEFAVNKDAWHAIHGDDVMPQVAGQVFDPPNPGAESPIVQTSYTLHVWLWQDNPQGLFAPFNSSLDCPAE